MMRIFVAGATGAIGSRLVPRVVDAGHEVVGTSTSPARAERVRALGATPVALHLLDAHAVRKAVRETEPEAIVQQATALANARFGRSLDRTFAHTNRCAPKAPTRCLPPRGRRGCRGSSRRASPATAMPATADGSRPRMIRSTRSRRRTRSRPTPR
jgi:NAD(P)-dependent dehydrogenase (short-subunit alcohol dehydrogenase family)